jgi:hypothetical protein
MARVLTPGGRLVMAEPNGDLRAVSIADRVLRRVDKSHVHLYRTDELEALATDAGFTDIEITPAERSYIFVRASRP